MRILLEPPGANTLAFPRPTFPEAQDPYVHIYEFLLDVETTQEQDKALEGFFTRHIVRLKVILSTFLLSQVLASFAFLFGITSYQFKDRRKILICWTLVAAFNSAHFLLLDRPGAGVLAILSGIRVFTSVFSTDRRFMHLFLILSLLSFFWVYQTPLSLLALLGSAVGTCASFQPADRTIRILMMICTLSWGIHNALAGTPVAALMEACFLVSNFLGYWRHYGYTGSRA